MISTTEKSPSFPPALENPPARSRSGLITGEQAIQENKSRPTVFEIASRELPSPDLANHQLCCRVDPKISSANLPLTRDIHSLERHFSTHGGLTPFCVFQLESWTAGLVPRAETHSSYHVCPRTMALSLKTLSLFGSALG